MFGTFAKTLHLSGLERAGAVICVTFLLGLGGALAAPSSVSSTALMGMLPLVAVLSLAALGQHLVIQQRGLDLSVAGTISLAAVIVTALPDRAAGASETFAFVLAAVATGATVGLTNGILVARLNVPALIATIGVNSLAIGISIWLAGGVPRQGPRSLVELGRATFAGLPMIPLFAVILIAVAALVMTHAVLGRNLTAVAVNPAAARLAAIPVEAMRIGTYAVAGASYGVAGVLLASYLATPSVLCGLPYVLASVAAVVLGGNSIAGGARASIVATATGAVFLTYLGQFVLALGLPVSVQSIGQAAIVIISALIAARSRT